VFVTGTDTGVGKTLVSCSILRALSRQGRRVGVYKPAETGCPRGPDGRLYGEDCRRLLAAANTGQAEGTVSSALYSIPAAPLVSAEAAGELLDPGAFQAAFEALAPGYDSVLVEGAGGLLVPIAPGFTYADLMQQLRLPVLLVVGSKLGCLNHALLTLAELERRGLDVVGYVLNEQEAVSDAPEAVATHRETLARFTQVPELGVLPYIGGAGRDDFEELASCAESALELSRLPL